jgi:hypothetical protein
VPVAKAVLTRDPGTVRVLELLRYLLDLSGRRREGNFDELLNVRRMRSGRRELGSAAAGRGEKEGEAL